MKQEPPVTRKQVALGLKKLAAAVRKHNYIVAAYPFGSAATRTAGPLSDIDVGFLLKKMPAREMHKRKLELIGLVQECFGRFEVDVVILNEAPNLLAFNVISGRLVASNNEDDRVLFEAQAMHTYLDQQYHTKLRMDEYFERVERRGLL